MATGGFNLNDRRTSSPHVFDEEGVCVACSMRKEWPGGSASCTMPTGVTGVREARRDGVSLIDTIEARRNAKTANPPTDVEVEAIKERWRDGESARSLADCFEATPGAIRRICRGLVSLNSAKGMTRSEVDTIIEMGRAGKSAVQTARHVNRSRAGREVVPSTVNRLFDIAMVDPRRTCNVCGKKGTAGDQFYWEKPRNICRVCESERKAKIRTDRGEGRKGKTK